MAVCQNKSRTGGLGKGLGKGWGKALPIQAILSEVDMGSRRLEVGLILRKAILVSGLLFTTETWSGLKETQLKRLEQVDQSLLRSLMDCHSKVAVEFIHMESGTLKLQQILTMNRMMYHHHILTSDENETIVKMYLKRKKYVLTNNFQRIVRTFSAIIRFKD